MLRLAAEKTRRREKEKKNKQNKGQSNGQLSAFIPKTEDKDHRTESKCRNFRTLVRFAFLEFSRRPNKASNHNTRSLSSPIVTYQTQLSFKNVRAVAQTHNTKNTYFDGS